MKNVAVFCSGFLLCMVIFLIKPNKNDFDLKSIELEKDSLKSIIKLNEDSILFINSQILELIDSKDSIKNSIENKEQNIKKLKKEYEEIFNHIDSCDFSEQIVILSEYLSEDSLRRWGHSGSNDSIASKTD